MQMGRYRHYKGGEYIVIARAMHTETNEWMVIYLDSARALQMWAQPESMFNEYVSADSGDHQVLRFTYIQPA